MSLAGRLRRVVVRDDFGRRAFRVARNWSNAELRRFAGRFEGSVVNVSAWEDKDKEGRTYREYFSGCGEYFITNYGTTQGELQGTSNEYFLDLEQPLTPDLTQRFDVVFNHTVLEHIWDFRVAFRNLCAMSKDTVAIVVPWLQPVHADYGDYWRFSPVAVVRLFHENGFTPMYVSWNESPASSVYVFCIATKDPARLAGRFPELQRIALSDELLRTPSDFAGKRAFSWRPWRGAVTRTI